MGHHHENEHTHHHHADQSEQPLPFKARMEKLLTHWTQHNDDHASNYREWAKRAGEENLAGISKKLEEAARLTDQITRTFEDAARLL